MAADDLEADKGEITPKMPIMCMFRSKIKIMGHLSMKNVRWRLLQRVLTTRIHIEYSLSLLQC
jgi:hypothetical protein